MLCACAIPGGVQKTCRYNTSGPGLAGMVVMGGWLDLISVVFSNLNDSMITEADERQPDAGSGWN